MWEDITVGLVRLLLLIDSIIYGFVSSLFGLFVDLANAKIFKESVIVDFSNRIYVVMGVIALFMITYSLLNSIINPDNFTKGKESGYKLVINLVISIALLALIPSIFNFAYDLQSAVLTDNIIGKIFLGTAASSNDNLNIEYEDGSKVYFDDSFVIKQRGNQLAWSVLNAFYYVDDGFETEEIEWSSWGIWADTTRSASWIACGGAIILVAGSAFFTYVSAGTGAATIPLSSKVAVGVCGVGVAANLITTTGELADVVINANKINWLGMEKAVLLGDFSLITVFAPIIREANSFVHYSPIISTIAGLFLLWMVFSYCLDLGLRAVKLAFYQMIAPVPILARLLPNTKNVFNNWVKITLTTYAEVFIRMIIMFSIIYLASHIGELTIPGGALGKAIIIMGLITFGRQAPKLISEITGIDSGNMKMGIMEKLGAGGALAAGALVGGAVVGGLRRGVNTWKNSRGQNLRQRVASTAKSSLGGAVSSGYRGAKNAGFKAKSFGDTLNAAKTGSKESYEKFQAKKKYKANHPGFAGVARGKAKDLWNDLIFDDELKQYNDRIKTVQDFDIQKKVNDWVSSNDAATKEADAALKNFESRKLSDSEIIEAERKRLESLINDKRVSKADRRKFMESLNKINMNDETEITNIRNAYLKQYFDQHGKLKTKRNEIRKAAIERFATTTGSEIQEMIIEANKIRNNNKTDELFGSTRNINFATVVDDLKANHESIAGKDVTPRDEFGNIKYTEVTHTAGTIEQMRSSAEYKKAFERYKEKVEKEGKS